MTDNLPAINDTLALIRDMAINPNVDADKLEKMLNLQERIMNKNAESEFNAAFMRLQEKIPPFKKTGAVYYPVDKNKPDGEKKLAFKFVKIDSMDEILPPLLRSEGFTLTHDSEQAASGGTIFIAILQHVNGHRKVTRTPPMPLDTSGGKNNLQGGGSSMSYGARYATKFALNLKFIDEDDDGHKGGLVFIDDKSVQALNDMIAETKADKTRFLEMLGVVAVENILATDYARAMNALITKRKKQETAK